MTVERGGIGEIKSGEKMFREMLNNTIKSTKDSGSIIGQSMKSVVKSVYNSKIQPIRPIKVKYKNWQGNISIRNIIPQSIHYGHTDYHKEDQWLMDVWDMEKDAPRTYAIMDIMEFIKEDK